MNVHRFGTVSSTNELLREMAEEGAPEWTAVLAEEQTEGRGRRGRVWYSPPGNLYLSVLLKPDISVVELPRMSLIVSLAVHCALRQRDVSLRLKWPNDVLWDGRKLAGILMEGKTKGETVHYVIAGIGINLRDLRGEYPEELIAKATSCEEAGIHWSPEELLVNLERSIDHHRLSYRGAAWKEARDEWCAHALWDRDYIYDDGTRQMRGRPVDLTSDGYLVLQTESGRMMVQTGELVEV